MLAIHQPEIVDDESTGEEGTIADPQDLRLEMKVKNNVLWHAIFDHHESVAALCRAHNKLKHHQTAISNLLRFKEYPLKKAKVPGKKNKWYYSSQYRSVCLKLEKALGILAEDLFPTHLYDHLVGSETEKAVEVSSFTALPAAAKREIRSLPAPTEQGLILDLDEVLLRERIGKVLKTLSYREREIIKLRFGLGDGYEYTWEEVANIFKVTISRIRQIEAKALQKLQQPSRSQELASFL